MLIPFDAVDPAGNPFTATVAVDYADDIRTDCRHLVPAGTVYFIDSDDNPSCAVCFMHEIAAAE